MDLGCRGGATRSARRRGRGDRGGSRSHRARAEAPLGRCTVRGGPSLPHRGRAPRRPPRGARQDPFEVGEYVAPPNTRESSMDLIQGVVVRPLKQIHDERGYLMEMLRTDWPAFVRFAQSYVTIGYPGIVKGWHYHKKQTDHFVVVRGTAKVVCYDNRDRSPTKSKVNEFFPGERNAMLIKIPPYVIHGFKAVGPEPVYLVNFPTELYNYKEPDEFRIPFDSKDIPYDWDVQMK